MTDITNNDKQNASKELIELDCDIVSKIFKKIKQKGIFQEEIKYDIDDSLVEIQKLSYSNDFMDLVKMHRLKKGLSMRYVATNIGKDEETYRKYEMKNFEIQDYTIAENIIKTLNLQDILELPAYFKIMKKYSKENIIEIINQVGKKTFSKETSIPVSTIGYWRQKNSCKKLSTNAYKRMVDFFINHNITY